MRARTTLDPQAKEVAGQYLTFELGGEHFGIAILRVQEIRGWSAVTPIPKTPDDIQGVLNLRGTVVPIIDLRRRLGLPGGDPGPTTVIVVANVLAGDNERPVGLVVDAVSDVRDVGAEELRAAPDFGGSVDVRYLSGMAALGERMLLLLDIDRLLEGATIPPPAAPGHPGGQVIAD